MENSDKIKEISSLKTEKRRFAKNKITKAAPDNLRSEYDIYLWVGILKSNKKASVIPQRLLEQHLTFSLSSFKK